MSRLPRRLFLTFALLVVGTALGHAAEHEGWFHGIFHHEPGHACPDSKAACPSESHAGCDCQGHDGAAPVSLAPAVLAHGASDLSPSTPPPALLLAARPALAAPLLAPPPPMASWPSVAGRGPLLI